MSYTLKVLDLPDADQPENPLLRTKYSYSYFNDIDNPQIIYEKKESGNIVQVLWDLLDQVGYKCITITTVAYLMENGVTIDTLRPD